MKRNSLSRQVSKSILALSLICSTSLSAFAGSKHRVETAGGTLAVEIDNFGKVNDHYYRGAQPKGRNYEQLAAIGVKTIVDLRADARPASKSEAEHAGLHYLNLPLEDKDYPPADAAERFLQIVNNPANWPVYVHCAGGRHRTGAMTAVYRMTVDGWDINRAYDEMRQYDFYTSWGHGCWKDYVYDYYRDRQPHQRVAPAQGTQTVARVRPRY